MKLNSWKPLFIALMLIRAASAFSQESDDAKLIEAARREGKVVWYTTMSTDHSKQFADRFHQRYPFVKPVVLRSGGGSLLNRAIAEANAGKHEWDVIHGTGDMVMPLKARNLVVPFFPPEAKMIDEDLKDQNGYWTAVYVNPVVLGFNTNLVKAAEVPRTYDDLLSPKFKGRKISFDDNYFTFFQGLINAWGREKAVAYLKKLAAQDLAVMGGTTVRVQLAAAGEHPMLIAYAPIIQNYVNRGAPLDWVALEPVVLSITTVQLADKARNPNAAKLFINFSLSKAGQQLLWDSNRVPVRKDVEPKPPRLLRGYKRIAVHPEGYKDYEETIKSYTEVMKSR
jgi:iron(III) transport system substrate-binding protein